MSYTSVSTVSVANVKVVGKGDRYGDDLAAAIVATMPDDFDWTARGACTAAILAACGVTKESAPKQKEGPKGEQTLTDWGRGIDSITKKIKALLKSDEAKPAVLRVTLSGEGGGSTTIPTDHPLYADLVALIAAGRE